VATELALELIDRETSVMPFSLEDTQRRATAGEVLWLSPLRARWTAPQAELIRADSHDLCDVRADPIPSAPPAADRLRRVVA
jgi:hypothetical protein